MQSQRRKIKKNKKRKTSKNIEPYGYQPDSHLTQHYITTGSVLPEKKKD